MPWFKVDDQIVGNKKFARIPRAERMAATGLWTTLGSWCARELTGGVVEQHMISEVGGTPKQAAALVSAGLWEEVDGGYQFVNWDEYQPTKEQVEADRKAARDRQQRARQRAREKRDSTVSHGVSHGVTPPVVTVPPTRPDPTPLSTKEEVAPRKRGSRLPDGWLPDPNVRAAMAKERPDLDLKLEHEKFTDHWKAKAGRDGIKLDWDATWRNWIRSARPPVNGRGDRRLQPVPAYTTPPAPDPKSLPW